MALCSGLFEAFLTLDAGTCQGVQGATMQGIDDLVVLGS
jgi:hypothetical protein